LAWGGSPNSLVIDESSAITNIYGLTLVGDTTFYMTNSAGGFAVNDLTTNQLQFASGFGGLTVGGGSWGGATTLIMSNYVLNSAGSSTVGDGFAIGSVLVTAGAVWSNNGSMFVNSGGFGSPSGSSLTITNGGQVFDTDGGIGMGVVTGGIFDGTNFTPIIGNADNNSVVVAGPGSLWQNSGDLYVGGTGSFNQLTISSGGQVLNANSYIGYDSNANNNTVSATGAASVWSNSGSLFVGYQGPGNSLTIANDSTVTASNVVIGAEATSMQNLLTVSGGNLLVTNVAGGGLLDIRRGTLDLNGGLVYASAITVSNGSFVTGSGTITGSLTSGGTIAPGASPGTLTVTGDLALLDTATLDMELRGTSTNEFDRLLVSGAFTADGILDVMLIDGFLPKPGDQFDLFNYASVGGSFNLINLPFGFLGLFNG
jgi:T5SS/PEP-CTERM-associated repeat protein